jgi:hypothetical protein
MPPLSCVLSDGGAATAQKFQMFNHTFYDKTKKRMERLIGWGHPTLLGLLSPKQTSLFIDGTFRCVPTQFNQCIVFLVHDRYTKGYYPAAFVLCTGKTYNVNFHAVRHVVDTTYYALEPAHIYCDF